MWHKWSAGWRSDGGAFWPTRTIAEALRPDQQLEPVKRERLERRVEMQALKQLRGISRSLRDKVHVIATQIELTRPELRVVEIAFP